MVRVNIIAISHDLDYHRPRSRGRRFTPITKNMITLNKINLRRGQHLLLEEVQWTIFHKQRIGLIGANGSGKSSLFAMLLGHIQPDSGELELPRRLKIAHVAQETPAYSKSALGYVLDGDEELKQLEHDLQLAEENNNGEHIAMLHARMSEIDAYSAPARAAQLLNGLGFNKIEQEQAVSDFSGGWRVRLNLARALISHSDILLLDEPTNHLDLDAIIWLENWLRNYKGTLLLISHDREFLDNIVNHIAHIDHKNLKLYTGNYSNFEKQRVANLLLQQAAYEKQQKHIAHLQSFINRFKAKASKAKQAQSRVKAIERMELIGAVQQESSFQFHFKKPDKCSNPMLTIEDATIQYGDKIVLKDINLSITPDDRIALIGPNGAGKSSLIKLLAGELKQASGHRETSANLKIGYFAQHQIDYLQLHETPLDHLRRLSPLTKEVELRTFLGSFGFSNDRVREEIKHFSGGEKSRLALSLLIWQKPNLILLDEPTNHLDLDMREALSLALQEYEGAMILVSHDRFLLRTTADQLILVASHKISPFTGDLDDYEKWLLDFRKQSDIMFGTSEKNNPSKKAQRKLDATEREARRPLVTQIKKLETQLETLQQEYQQLEIQLLDPTLYEAENKSNLQSCLLKQAEIKKQLQTTEASWLLTCEQLDIHDKNVTNQT